jgi:hypothetical protein
MIAAFAVEFCMSRTRWPGATPSAAKSIALIPAIIVGVY